MWLLAIIEAIISTTVKICSDLKTYNPFVRGCKIVVEMISITEYMLDFVNSGFRRRKSKDEVAMS